MSYSHWISAGRTLWNQLIDARLRLSDVSLLRTQQLIKLVDLLVFQLRDTRCLDVVDHFSRYSEVGIGIDCKFINRQAKKPIN